MPSKFSHFYQRIKKYFFNTSWIMLEKILTLLSGLLITVLIARYLGPAKFGVLSYAMSLVGLFATAGHVGLAGLAVREFVKYPEKQRETMGATFLLKSIGYFAGLTSLIIFVYFTKSADKDNVELLTIAILSITLLIQPFEVIDFWFQSKLQAKYTALARTTSLVLTAGLKVGLILIGSDVLGFAFANVIQSLCFTVLLILCYKKSNKKLSDWIFSLKRAKELFKDSWVVFLGAIFASIYLKIDQVMLKWYLGDEAVGIYSVASTLSETWYFIPVAIVSSFFPKLIELREADPQLYKVRMQLLFDFLFVLSFSLSLVVTFTAEPVMRMLFGEKYVESIPILVVHIWSGVFVFLRTLFSRWILIENLLMFSVVSQGIGAIVNVILNIYMIPAYGGLGAAYATLISYSAAGYFSLLIYKPTRAIFWMMTNSLFSPIIYPITVYKKMIKR